MCLGIKTNRVRPRCLEDKTIELDTKVEIGSYSQRRLDFWF